MVSIEQLGVLFAMGASAITVVLYFGKSKQEMIHTRKAVDNLEVSVNKLLEMDKNIALLTQKITSIETDFKSSILAVMQHRVSVLEVEMDRARVNIHKLANDIQVELVRKEDASIRRQNG